MHRRAVPHQVTGRVLAGREDGPGTHPQASIAEVERERVGDLLDEFLSALDAGEGEQAVAGRDATEEALEYEGVETTLAAEDLPAEELRDLEGRTLSQGGEFVLVPADADGADRFREEGKVGAMIRFPIEE